MGIFVAFDVVTTVIQVVGAALIGVAESNNNSPVTGNNILLAGLAIQVASFAVFLSLLSVVVLRVTRKRGNGRWAHLLKGQTLLAVLVVTSLLVELRTIFRLIETAQGASCKLQHVALFCAAPIHSIVVHFSLTCKMLHVFDFQLLPTAGVFGHLSSHEVYFGCLEYLPIILTVGLWNLFHPGRLLSTKGHILPVQSSQSEVSMHAPVTSSMT